MRKLTRLSVTIVGVLIVISAMHRLTTQTVKGQGTLQVVNIKPNAHTIGRYEKFELSFDITGTEVTNPYFPYDPDPPAGVPAGVGITVDGLFSPDNWTTVYTQPAFLYHPYTYTVQNDQDHLYPSGTPEWKIRFAPPVNGIWHYRIRAINSSGTTIYPVSRELTFTVVSSDNPGFLHVSSTDPRYFEFDNGTPFIGVGHGDGFNYRQAVKDAKEKFAHYSSNRANFFRTWVSGASIFGSAWWPWTSHHLGFDGYLPPTSLTIEEAYNSGDVSMKLWEDNPCMFQGFTGAIPVLPERDYSVKVRIKTSDVTGPAQTGEPYGFVVKLGGWLGQNCSSTETGTPVTPYMIDTNDAWQIVTGTLTTDTDQYFLDNLYLTLSNATGGAVYVDEVWLKEKLGHGEYGPNLVRKPKMNAHTYFDPYPAWQWDRILDEAGAHDIYLKLVTMEKNEWIFNRITPSGTMTTTDSNNNFYAAPNTKARWLHEAWWRYLIARWGYSRAVHSWELMNEGDPFNGYHYEQANAFARYIHTHDPQQHMATTSLWCCFPMDTFWANPNYSDIDYADLHAYVSTGWGKYAVIPDTPSPPLTYTDAADYDGSGWSLALDGSTQTHMSRLWRLGIQGDGEWILRYRLRMEGWSGLCEESNALSGPRLYWLNWKQNIVPPRSDGEVWRCSTPAASNGWVTYDSAHTADGEAAPLEARIIITDGLPHLIAIGVQNTYGNSGTAYFDAIELIAPDGTVLPLNGNFELSAMHEDAALYTSAYSLLWGGKSQAGAKMPLVRGEAGLDHPGGPQEELEDLALDTEGTWLHNLVWGGINPGGMYDLYWWTDNINNHDLYYHYKPYRDFMDDIPLNNGYYHDAEAVASHPEIRAWGQKDVAHRKAHLWIQNRQHTWRNVVDDISISKLSGRITIPNMPPGPYQIEWWNTYTGLTVKTESVEASSEGLVLNLPAPLGDDIAAKASWAGPSLNSSNKTANRFTARPGDILTYTITLDNAGATSTTVTMTDEIPTGTTYILDSATVTPDSGDLEDDASSIRWLGEIESGAVITITFAVQVEPKADTDGEPFIISNTAMIEAGSERIERQALTVVNACRIYLPLILKSG